MRYRAYISFLMVALLGALAPVARAATVTFTADLANFSASPTTAYVKILLQGCDSSKTPNVSSTPVNSTQTLTPTGTVVSGTVTTTATLSCGIGAVAGGTKWKVEVWDTGPPDKKIYSASYVIGPGNFDLSTAVASAVYLNSTVQTNPIGTQRVIQPTGTAFKGIGAFDFTNAERVGANGEKDSCSWQSELLTLSTSGVTSDTTANLLPANSLILGVVARVTTTITTATDWKLGDATTGGRFAAANSTLTAGTTTVGAVHLTTGIASATTGFFQASAAKVRVTTTGTPGAGAIRVSVLACSYTPPTS